MKYVLFLFILVSMNLHAQSKKQNSGKDFYDKIIDFAIENCEDKFIELPDLYDSTVEKVADDKTEKLILVDKLKKRGFIQTDWGRGNYPPFGPRLISVTVKKADCECEIVKIYYLTINESEYLMTEKIKCRRASQ